MIDFEAYINDEAKDLQFLFPNQEKVFADWFTGQIRIPMGEMLQYIHQDYESIYEKDLLLNLKDGVLISEKVIENCYGNKKIKLETMLQRIQANEEYYKTIIQNDKKE